MNPEQHHHVLRIQNLAKQYDKTPILKNISFTLRNNEIVGLLGPNGAGKTTCFYSILGLVTCDQGQIFLDETDITDFPIHQRALAGLGYLPQEPSIFRKLTVYENVLAILETRSDLSKTDQKKEAQALLDEFNITHLSNTLGIRLSGGERRRVEIARTVARNPKFILLDEPFAGIAPISIQDIKKMIRHLRNRGIGILITDHNVRDTLAICDKAYIVNDGYIIASGAPDIILSDSDVRSVYLGESFAY